MKTIKELAQADVWVDEIYLPFLGKSLVNNEYDEKTNCFKAESIKVLNKNRKNENGSYEIVGDINWTEDVSIEIDYENKTVKGYYFKKWIGGLVEKVDFEYTIEKESIKTKKDPIEDNVTHITFTCKEVK